MMDCNVEQELCSVYRGDSINYDLEFKREDGSPVNVSGMTLTYTAKLNPDDVDGLPENIQVKHIFPEDAESINGSGELVIPASKTKNLIPGRRMKYDFVLANGSNVTTIGAGSFMVLQNVATNKN